MSTHEALVELEAIAAYHLTRRRNPEDNPDITLATTYRVAFLRLQRGKNYVNGWMEERNSRIGLVDPINELQGQSGQSLPRLEEDEIRFMIVRQPKKREIPVTLFRGLKRKIKNEDIAQKYPGFEKEFWIWRTGIL